MCVYIYMPMYIYTYTEEEQDKERGRDRDRERERDREEGREAGRVGREANEECMLVSIRTSVPQTRTASPSLSALGVCRAHGLQTT